MFGGNFAPRGWAFCQGQILSIAQNTALFALLGTTYGGNGQTTFALPDLRGRSPMGPSNTNPMGALIGSPQVSLNASQLPAHNHIVTGNVSLPVNTTAANAVTPAGNFFANDGSARYDANHDNVAMKPANVNLVTSISGASQPLSNMMPYLGVNYIICMEGIFPSRN